MGDKQILLGVLFTTLLLLLLVAGIFISIYIAGKHRMQQEIKITQMELSFEKEMRQTENEVSEHMMEQFAQELHDNIGHLLTCMRITIENKKMDNPDNVDSYEPIEGYLDEASEQIKLLSRSLNTEYVKNTGLYDIVQLEVKRINDLKRQTIHLKGELEQLQFGKDVELLVFRMFQEMMNNSIKHSRAKNIYINLASENGFMMEVYDDGKGFDLEKTLNSPRASGLKNIIKRAKMAGMDCKIASSAGNGCRYVLRQTNTI